MLSDALLSKGQLVVTECELLRFEDCLCAPQFGGRCAGTWQGWFGTRSEGMTPLLNSSVKRPHWFPARYPRNASTHRDRPVHPIL